ncbi:hypothetical protein D3C71_1913230 [compost metagenome]
MDQFPLVATAVPSTVVPSVSYKVTVEPASAVPVNTGIVTLVMLSEFEIPLSLAVAITGVDGAFGAVVSMTKSLFAPNDPAVPGAGKVNAALAPIAF